MATVAEVYIAAAGDDCSTRGTGDGRVLEVNSVKLSSINSVYVDGMTHSVYYVVQLTGLPSSHHRLPAASCPLYILWISL